MLVLRFFEEYILHDTCISVSHLYLVKILYFDFTPTDEVVVIVCLIPKSSKEAVYGLFYVGSQSPSAISGKIVPSLYFIVYIPKSIMVNNRCL